MDGTNAGPEFHNPNVYKLVTTRAMRDEKNAMELEHSIRQGEAAMTIHAVNKGGAGSISDDVMRLPTTLHLCTGARVMITRNM